MLSLTQMMQRLGDFIPRPPNRASPLDPTWRLPCSRPLKDGCHRAYGF